MRHINTANGDWLDRVLDKNTKLYESLPVSIISSCPDSRMLGVRPAQSDESKSANRRG